jgi:hypothetical protein
MGESQVADGDVGAVDQVDRARVPERLAPGR